MKKTPVVHIPKPCSEDWDKMRDVHMGRFCNSCNKSVIDFTDMSPSEIAIYLQEHSEKSICGHFRKEQVQTPLKIRIPLQEIPNNLNFNKSFLLILLLVMGTTLFSCKNDEGTIRPINSVELVSDINIDSISKIDTIKNDPANTPINEETTITGVIVLPDDKNNFYTVKKPPEFLNTPDTLTSQEKRNLFQRKINAFVDEKFNRKIIEKHAIKGKHRIYTRFSINPNGAVENIQVRATNEYLKQEAFRVLSELPKFKPAENISGKKMSISYSLPILLMGESL